MAEATILKNSQRQAVVLAVGNGTFYANLQSLLHANVTGHTVQTFDEANAVLSITAVSGDTSAGANVVRNSTTVYAVTAGQNDLELAQKYGSPITTEGNANVQIQLSGYGSVILEFSKQAGFNDPDRQNQGPGVT